MTKPSFVNNNEPAKRKHKKKIKLEEEYKFIPKIDLQGEPYSERVKFYRKECPICTKEFTTQSQVQHTCSRECAMKGRIKSYSCINCKDKFDSAASNVKFCSTRCKFEYYSKKATD